MRTIYQFINITRNHPVNEKDSYSRMNNHLIGKFTWNSYNLGFKENPTTLNYAIPK